MRNKRIRLKGNGVEEAPPKRKRKKRRKKKAKAEDGGAYFDVEPTVEFISSGCRLLDCVLGGGYAVGRIINIIGDKSTGKTLLAIEAAANFAKTYEDGIIWYNEVEATFDKGYAETLGMPVERVKFVEEAFTVEEFFKTLQISVKETSKKGVPGLYILDSLDALSDEAEQRRDMDEGSYGMEKAKKLGELFRRLVRNLGRANVTVIIISQVRDRIGRTFGRKTRRSGGRALDFYASQVFYLSQLKEERKTIHKIRRTVAIRVKVKCDKNKVGLPFRECEFPLVFGYGVDDVMASLEWLKSIGKLTNKWGRTKTIKRLAQKIENLPPKKRARTIRQISKSVTKNWNAIETSFMPKRKKYE